MKLIIGITGATGAILGIRLLEILKNTPVETHLVMSNWAAQTIKTETSYTIEDVQCLADETYSVKELGAKISSGSFLVDGMIVAPYSMKSLASIRVGLADNLITRAAYVMLKENKKLLLMVRETPLNTIYLENMFYLSKMCVIIFPPTPAFYNQSETIEDIVDHLAYRALDQFNLHLRDSHRWEGLTKKEWSDKSI